MAQEQARSGPFGLSRGRVGVGPRPGSPGGVGSAAPGPGRPAPSTPPSRPNTAGGGGPHPGGPSPGGGRGLPTRNLQPGAGSPQNSPRTAAPGGLSASVQPSRPAPQPGSAPGSPLSASLGPRQTSSLNVSNNANNNQAHGGSGVIRKGSETTTSTANPESPSAVKRTSTIEKKGSTIAGTNSDHENITSSAPARLTSPSPTNLHQSSSPMATLANATNTVGTTAIAISTPVIPGFEKQTKEIDDVKPTIKVEITQSYMDMFISKLMRGLIFEKIVEKTAKKVNEKKTYGYIRLTGNKKYIQIIESHSQDELSKYIVSPNEQEISKHCRGFLVSEISRVATGFVLSKQLKTGVSLASFAKGATGTTANQSPPVKINPEKEKLMFTIVGSTDKNSIGIKCMNRPDLITWTDGLRFLLGHPCQNRETLEEIDALCEAEAIARVTSRA